MKPKLVLYNEEWSGLFDKNINPYITKFFTLSQYDKSKTYSKESIFVITDCNAIDDNLCKLMDNGIKVLYDNTWEMLPVDITVDEDYQDSITIVNGGKNNESDWKNSINVPSWFWFQESNGLKETAQSYTPNKTRYFDFLMLMNKRKPERDIIYDKMRFDHALISYVEKGTRLGGDMPDRYGNIHDRHFNKNWYDDTYYNIIVESIIDTSFQKGPRKYDFIGNVFLTEKTFKPIAYQQPFQLLALPGSLQYLQEMGFVTYAHMFDETYDGKPLEEKLEIVYNNVEEFNIDAYNSKVTNEIVQHNYNHFFNESLLHSIFKSDVVEPIMEIINGKICDES